MALWGKTRAVIQTPFAPYHVTFPAGKILLLFGAFDLKNPEKNAEILDAVTDLSSSDGRSPVIPGVSECIYHVAR